MKILSIFVIFSVLLCSARGQAVIEGKVKLPKPRPVDVINKRYELNGEPAVVVPDPPAAVIYLEGEFPAPKTPPRTQMAQKNMEFVPPLLPIQVGTVVEFPNKDEMYHNIFSYSKPKRFDLGRYRGDEKPIPFEVFDKPGVETLRCDIHEHMRGIILILETPHFVRTDTDGHYRLGNLPAGHYKLKVWLDSKTTLEREVDLKSGNTLHADFQ